MFQQFKNIFPNTNLNIRSITNSVGLNEAEWSRGVERLEAIKNEFQNFNSLITRTDSSDTLHSMNNSTAIIERSSLMELEATNTMVQRLHKGCSDIQDKNKDNFRKAKVAEYKLNQLQNTGQLHIQTCQQMANSGSDIDEMKNNIDHIQTIALSLMDTLSTLEDQINNVTLDAERREFELWKEQEEVKLQSFAASKREQLKQKEDRLRQAFEENDAIQQQKRVELYEANFNAELEDYKRRRENEVSSLYSRQTSTTKSISLDDLQLEEPDEELDDFFGGDKQQVTKSKKEKKEKKLKKTSKKKPVTPVVEDSSSNDEDRVEILVDEDYDDDDD
ncbi:hypothetical protein K501DRAFT_332605 [Backusella circina FSU 941]|nr:hypothetical protein K501DRAFT_332605 [Backusella circina FSU 941]